MKLILGTAQLGMKYGVNNLRGQLTHKESFKLLDCAFNLGIDTIDTASAYGEAENIIGEYIRNTNNHIKVCTKLIHNIYGYDKIDKIEKEIDRSLTNLNVDYIDHYFVHDIKDIINNKDLISILSEFKGKKINKIGISLYDKEDLEYVLENYGDSIDTVQIPYNVLNKNSVDEEMKINLRSKNIEVFARSIYVQGLIFCSKNKLDLIHKNAYKYIEKLKRISIKYDMTLEELSFQYVNSNDFIKSIIIGCEDEKQIIRNVSMLHNKKIFLSNEDIEDIDSEFINIEKEIVDPRLWSK